MIAQLTGILATYVALSRLMYSMARNGYLPGFFSRIDERYGTPKNAMLFCILVSLSGPILGREALGWFVDMSAIGASIGFLCTGASTFITMRRNGDKRPGLKVASILSVAFSSFFIFLQLIPIPGLESVHFCRQSYLMLVIWILLGLAFFIRQRQYFHER